MLTLYHFGASICAQKVRLALSEKGLLFDGRDVTGMLRDPEFLAVSPHGVVPVLVHGGHVLIESRIISEYIEDAFPEPALLPRNPYARYRARYWSKQSDDRWHLQAFTISAVAYMRDRFLAIPPENRVRDLPGMDDPIKRRRVWELMEHGFDSIHVLESLLGFAKTFSEVEASLAANGPWLAGADYSLADADLTPYMHRLAAVGLGALWVAHPRVTDWFDRVRERPSYRTAISDWITPRDLDADRAVLEQSRPVFTRLLASIRL
jgi:glutathione S-transferase